MEYFTKQSWEQFVIAGNFEDVLGSGETISLGSSEVLAYDANDADVTTTVIGSGTLELEGAKLKVKIQAGSEDDSPYKITFRAVTNLENQWELDVRMKVREI
jgi:hypothetical protein